MFLKPLSILILSLICLSAYGQLSIDPPTRAFAKDGGGGAILTTGVDSWTASTDADWITITPYTSGTPGQVVVYIVDANLTANPRQGVINVNDETHTISQTGYATTLSPSTHQHDLYGGSHSFDVTTSAGVYWTATTEADWITVSNGSGYGGGTVTYTVAPYGGVATRTGEIQVGSSAYMVQQTGADVNISPTSVYKEYSSDVILVDVSALSSTTWTPTTQQSWISIASPGSGQGDSMIAVAIGTNPSYEEREGSVEIGSISLNIRQAGNPLPALNIVPTEATAEPVGAYGNIAVLATPDAPWVAQSLSPWITLTDTNGSGNGNIGYVASSNPTLEPRVGTVRVNAPYVPPMVDLTTSLQAMFQDGNDYDYSGWVRHRVGPDGTFNGGHFWSLQGHAIQASTDELTIFADFSFVNTGAIHRIFGVNDHGYNIGLYINADNKLVFQSNDQKVISDITFTNNQYYDVAATVATDGTVKLYAAEDGTDAVLVGSSNFSTPVYLMTESTPATSFKIGAGDQPNTGVLNEAVIEDFRLYARSLRQQDVEALFRATPSEPYGTPEVTPVTPVASYDLRGSGAAKVWGAHNFAYYDQNFRFVDSVPIEGMGKHEESAGAMKVEASSYFSMNNIRNLFSDTEKDATYTYWIKIDQLPTTNSFYDLLNITGDSTSAFRVQLDTNGDIKLIWGPDTNSETFNCGLVPNQWYMLALSAEEDEAFTIFINGEEAGSISRLDGINYGDGNVCYLGGWDGSVSEFNIYNSSLSSSQLRELFKYEKPIFEDHKVFQGHSVPTLSSTVGTIAPEGGSASTELLLTSLANWVATSSEDWLQINSATSGMGSTILEVFALENPSIGTRTANISIAGLTFTVSQLGQPSTISAPNAFFNVDGGSAFINISNGGSASWSATSNDDWLTVALGLNGEGSGQVTVVANPYTETSQSRTGSVTIGDTDVYFTQRGYDISISPQVAEVGGNSNAGEIGISAPLGAVWEAIVTKPWISLIGATNGSGNGTLNYSISANDSGLDRTGSVLISGEEYIINQSQSLLLEAGASHGSVTGSGSYDTNEVATLTAIPENGYLFSHWTGDAVGFDNPLNIIMDDSKSVQAHFIPEAATSVIASGFNLVSLSDIINNVEAYGLYDLDSLDDSLQEEILLSKDDVSNTLNLPIKVLSSSNLIDWVEEDIDLGETSIAEGNLNISIGENSSNKFYIIKAEK